MNPRESNDEVIIMVLHKEPQGVRIVGLLVYWLTKECISQRIHYWLYNEGTRVFIEENQIEIWYKHAYYFMCNLDTFVQRDSSCRF